MQSKQLLSIVVGFVALGILLGTVGCVTGQGQKKQKEEKQSADWHYQMGVGYLNNQKIYPAIRELSKALEMDPKMAKAHFSLGFIYTGRKKYHEAIEHYKEALRINPKYHQARNNLGSVYLAMERWRDAAELYEKLSKESMYPNPELAHNNLGWAQHNLRKYDKAIDNFKQAIFLKPEMCLAYNNLGLTYEEMGNTSKAVENYRKAIRKCPNSYAKPHFNLGKILQNRGEPGARRHFERCVKIDGETNLADRCREYLQLR